MRVWVVETGEYEQRYVVGVFTSIRAGVAKIKETYGPPYVVRWEPAPSSRAKYPTLTGHFAAVAGSSTRHTAHFEFTAHDLA